MHAYQLFAKLYSYQDLALFNQSPYFLRVWNRITEIEAYCDVLFLQLTILKFLAFIKRYLFLYAISQAVISNRNSLILCLLCNFLKNVFLLKTLFPLLETKT